MGKRNMALWHGSYRVRAKALTDAAYADPRTTCWICNRTLQEGPRYRNGALARWHADHVIAGDPRSPLRPAHSLCNERRGRPVSDRQPKSPNG